VLLRAVPVTRTVFHESDLHSHHGPVPDSDVGATFGHEPACHRAPWKIRRAVATIAAHEQLIRWMSTSDLDAPSRHKRSCLVATGADSACAPFIVAGLLDAGILAVPLLG